jgi:hypothetical protein
MVVRRDPRSGHSPAGALPSIIAYARAGALDVAWQAFVAAGYDRSDDDPAALNLKGRLLKDRASRSMGDERTRLLRDAAAAYGRAAVLGSATYPLINAATLSLLAGDGAGAAQLAQDVLDTIERYPDEPETPYYRVATRAEALLLLRREGEAQVALRDAVALAPRAWEDHASTLRQFALILGAQGGDTAWLNVLRPPRSLHFGGHMSFGPKPARAELVREIGSIFEEERVGFGYGALAAGADIIVAEALIERGAELHAVLPGSVESFAALSVDPFGKEWRRRFDAAIERAETVRLVRPLGARPDETMIGLADEVAMGSALMNAQRLASEAVQLLILDSKSSSGRARDLWAEAGRRQRLVTAPRENRVPAGEAKASPCRRVAILVVDLNEAGLEEQLSALKTRLDTRAAPVIAPYLAERKLVLAYETALEAAAAGMELLAAQSGLRIGGHYCAAGLFREPFGGTDRLAGDGVTIAAGAASSSPPGTLCVSDDFAAALAVAGKARLNAEYIGELDASDGGAPIGLYAVKS